MISPPASSRPATGATATAGVLPSLRRPWQLGSVTVPHRVVMGSMHTGREDDPDALAAFYRERVRGGAGLIISGGLSVSDEARGGPDYMVLTDPVIRDGMRQVTAAVHEDGGVIAAQLFHAGRYAVGEWALAPTPLPWKAARGIVPREMTGQDIARTIDDFAAAAVAARDAGFDAVEIMASEGYLLNQFLSPLTNTRQDEWGGDAEARRRFPLAVVRAVREAVGPQFPVTVRVSVADLMEGSSTQEEADAFALGVVGAGVDGLSMGVGWHESPVPTVQTGVPHEAWIGYGEHLADLVHGVAPDLPVIATNKVVDLDRAEEVVARGHVDAIALARPFLADPRLVERSFAGEKNLVSRCLSCNQACLDHSLRFRPISCLVNPRAGRELEFPEPAARPAEPEQTAAADGTHRDAAAAEARAADEARGVAEARRVAVVGGGPAGLAAAEDLVGRGHQVTLFERGDELGGQFRLATRVPGKEDYGVWADSAAARLEAGACDVRLRTAPLPEDLAGFDAVILATGVVPRRIDVPGIDLPHVLDYEHALRDGVPAGDVAIIGGGGIGVDMAETLVESPDPAVRARRFVSRHTLVPAPVGPMAASSTRPQGGEDPTGAVPDADAVLPSPAGRRITVMRRSGRVGKGTGVTSRWVHLGALADGAVRTLTDLEYSRITAEAVEILRGGGDVGDQASREQELIPARTVIICAGQEVHDPYSRALTELGVRFEVVGGARDASGVDAVRATREGLEAARRLTASS
jgi:2,4-dienoyl-CoA reductase (NADPH2)